MTRGLMKTASGIAIAAAAGLFASNAMAADLGIGGNCCADLEERVAELEATTARKGNRKVSLTVYGRITTGIIWHDSDEDDAYRSEKLTVRQNNNSPTVFGFKGEAQVRPDLTAGYWMEIWVQEDTGTSSKDGAFTIRQNNVYLDHQTFGRITLGQSSTNHDGLYEINLANTLRVPGQGNEEMGLIGNAYKTTFDDPFDGGRFQGIYYRTPSLAGFVLGAGYFHDRQDTALPEVDTTEGWEVALRYAGEFNGVRVAAGIGYREMDNKDADASKDAEDPTKLDPTKLVDDQTWLGSASVMHMPTGLFLSGGYANTDSKNEARERSGWWVMAGIEKNFFGVGNTTIYGEYNKVDWKREAIGVGLDGDSSQPKKQYYQPTGDRLDGSFWGFGIVQTIDSAATDLYINFRRYSLDGGVGTKICTEYEGVECKSEPDALKDIEADSRDANVVTAGMRIQF